MLYRHGASLSEQEDEGAPRERLFPTASKEAALTPTEYRLLVYLAQHVGQFVTQDALLEYIWGPAYIGESDLLQANITRLRRKLEHDPAHPRYILIKNWDRVCAGIANFSRRAFWGSWYSRA